MKEINFIPLSELRFEGAGFTNPRPKEDPDEELAESIRDNGLRQPLKVWETKEGKEPIFVLLGGGRRYTAIEYLIENDEAGDLEKKIPYTAFHGSLVEAKVEAMVDNLHRKDFTSYQLAVQIDELVELGMSQQDIAKKINRSGAWVSRVYTAYKGATDKLKSAWKDGALPLDTVQDLATLAEKDQDKAVGRIIAKRSEGGRVAKTAARQAAKKSAGKSNYATPKQVRELAMQAQNAPEDGSYVHGMRDAFRFLMGEIGVSDFGVWWTKFMNKMKPAVDDEEPEPNAESLFDDPEDEDDEEDEEESEYEDDDED